MTFDDFLRSYVETTVKAVVLEVIKGQEATDYIDAVAKDRAMSVIEDRIDVIWDSVVENIDWDDVVRDAMGNIDLRLEVR